MDYLVKDAVAALEVIDLRFPGRKLGLIGHSEGALVSLRVAALRSGTAPLDALFLLAPPTQDFDEVLKYQFHDYPLRFLREKYDQNRDGLLSGDETSALNETGLPALSILGVNWRSLDQDQDGALSLETDLVPAYAAGLLQIKELVNTTMKPWYDSIKALPDFPELAQAVKNTPVHDYQGLKDPQVDGALAPAASNNFRNLKALRLFPEYGHGFAPLEGVHGEVKTSGRFQDTVLKQLVQDLADSFRPV